MLYGLTPKSIQKHIGSINGATSETPLLLSSPITSDIYPLTSYSFCFRTTVQTVNYTHPAPFIQTSSGRSAGPWLTLTSQRESNRACLR